MSNRTDRRPTAYPTYPTYPTYPAHPVTAAAAPTARQGRRPAPSASTDRPTATYPIGQAPDPAGYLHPADPRLGRADATPTGVFPTNRSARTPVRVSTQPEPTDGREGHEQPSTDQESIQDMGRPGILARPSMRWHPSLMQLAIGAALVAALLGACNVAAIQAHRQARAYCHALAVSDWDRAQRECRGTGAGTPVPEQVPTASVPSPDAPAPVSGQTADWVTEDTHAPYSKDDPAASPLDLPPCTTAPDTPLPCLASTFPQNSNENPTRVVVLEEDASLTALVRR